MIVHFYKYFDLKIKGTKKPVIFHYFEFVPKSTSEKKKKCYFWPAVIKLIQFVFFWPQVVIWIIVSDYYPVSKYLGPLAYKVMITNYYLGFNKAK